MSVTATRPVGRSGNAAGTGAIARVTACAIAPDGAVTGPGDG